MISKGDNIKGYIIEDQLGAGGFGTVYLVHKENAQDKKFALKLLKSQFLQEPNRREQFINEMITMARLSMHPSIVTIYHTLIYEDQEGEHLGMILEYVQGESLSRFIYHHGKLVAAKAVPLFLQVLDAVQTAHENGIIHRDIKPSNIMVLTGETINYQGYFSTHPVKILDFGLAKITNEGITEETDTMSGISPAYTPPERLLGKRIGPYTDIYAVGVTLYEALTGISPFQIKSIQDIERVITKEKPSSILAHYEHHPAVLNDVVQKALAKTPEDRYMSCAEFGAALAMAYHPSMPEPEPPKSEPPNSLSRWLLGVSFLIVLIIGAVAIYKFTPYHIFGKDAPSSGQALETGGSKGPPEATHPVTKGFISIKSNPSEAEVFIDGTRRGETPLDLDDISIGNHQLKLRKRPYYKEFQETISIDTVGKKQITRTLHKLGESLRILSEPSGAKIFWNDVYIGKTPEIINNVLRGTYYLILKKEDYNDYNKIIRLNEMTEKELSFDLVKKVGSWYVESVPHSAKIYLDGNFIGLTPQWIPESTYGSYRLEIKHEGYEDYTGSLDITDNSKRKREIELVKIMGAVNIKSQPTDAYVYLDDERKGFTDILISDIPFGEHRLRIQKNGYKPYETKISVIDGRTVEKEYTLERNDRCTDGKLNSSQIRALVTNKKTEGTSLDRSATWEEIQYSDGTAVFINKDNGKRYEGKWKTQDDQICWCYGDCKKDTCKIMEADDDCSTFYYINPKDNQKTGKILYILDI